MLLWLIQKTGKPTLAFFEVVAPFKCEVAPGL